MVKYGTKEARFTLANGLVFKAVWPIKYEDDCWDCPGWSEVYDAPLLYIDGNEVEPSELPKGAEALLERMEDNAERCY